MILSNRKKRWKTNQSPLFLEFLAGSRDYECTPWGNPTYNIFGWQRPCYLLQEGYVDTFQELIDTVEWDNYGKASGNPKCRDCMVHCGYEPTAVDHTFSSFGGIWGNIKAMLFNRYANPGAMQRLKEEEAKPHGPMAHLVQLGYGEDLKDKAGGCMNWWVHSAWEQGPVYLISWIFWVLFAITLHELAHGWAALWEGDTTPRDLNRLTANRWCRWARHH